MGWQVALILDCETDPGRLLSQMPVWAISTSSREASATKMREDWEGLWAPEPALTLLNPDFYTQQVENLPCLVPTLGEHHPRMACLRIYGVSDSEALRTQMASVEYAPVSAEGGSCVGFARPIRKMSSVPELLLDATCWQTANDVYDAFLRAVGAPSWHGRNFDALNDSIATGNINKTEVPYRILIQNAGLMSGEAAIFVRHFEGLVQDLQAVGCPVEMQVKP